MTQKDSFNPRPQRPPNVDPLRSGSNPQLLNRGMARQEYALSPLARHCANATRLEGPHYQLPAAPMRRSLPPMAMTQSIFIDPGARDADDADTISSVTGHC